MVINPETGYQKEFHRVTVSKIKQEGYIIFSGKDYFFKIFQIPLILTI